MRGARSGEDKFQFISCYRCEIEKLFKTRFHPPISTRRSAVFTEPASEKKIRRESGKRESGERFQPIPQFPRKAEIEFFMATMSRRGSKRAKKPEPAKIEEPCHNFPEKGNRQLSLRLFEPLFPVIFP